MGIGRNGYGAADFSGLHVVVDRAAQRHPSLLPVPPDRGCRLRASEANKVAADGVERQPLSHTPGTLELRQRLLERMRGQQTLARQTRYLARIDGSISAPASGVSRQLRGAILDAVAEKGLEGLCDGRVPARSATGRDARAARPE